VKYYKIQHITDAIQQPKRQKGKEVDAERYEVVHFQTLEFKK